MKFEMIVYLLLFVILNSVTVSYAQDDAVQQRPMTKYEKEMLKVPDIGQLEDMWDTLSTDYQRRYFLNGLLGYSKDKEVKEMPAWVTAAVKQSLKSKDPNLVCEAILAAGQFNLDCADELMNLYPKISTTFGCHEDMLKSSILYSIKGMTHPGKEQFLYSILEKEPMNMLSASFETLLAAIDASPNKRYVKKLDEYASQMEASIQMVENDPKEGKHYLQQYRTIKDKINGTAKKSKEK